MSAGIQQPQIIHPTTPSLTRLWVNGMEAVRTFIGAATIAPALPLTTFEAVTRTSIDLGKLMLAEYRLFGDQKTAIPEINECRATETEYPELHRQFQDIVANVLNVFETRLQILNIAPARAKAMPLLWNAANREAGQNPALYQFINWLVLGHVPELTNLSISVEPALNQSRLQLTNDAAYQHLRTGLETFIGLAVQHQSEGLSLKISLDGSGKAVTLTISDGGNNELTHSIDIGANVIPFADKSPDAIAMLGVSQMVGGQLTTTDISKGIAVFATGEPYAGYRLFFHNDRPLLDVSETPAYRAIEAANKVAARAEKFAWK